MALSADQATEAAQLLQEHPDWTNSAVCKQLGLPPTAMFSVRAVRRAAGIAEPAGQVSSSPKRRRSSSGAAPKRRRSSGAAAGVTSDTLDDDDDALAGEPTGPKRTAGRPKSMLAPVLPRLAQSIMIGLQAGTYNLTRGVAPMSKAETQAIAIPVVRIADRTAAKYIRRTGKVTENQEDLALIALTVVMWAVGWIMASIMGRKTQPASQAAPEPIGADLFVGSEPSGPSQAAPSSVIQPEMGPAATSAGAAADESDLFAGAEPVAADSAAAPVSMNGYFKGHATAVSDVPGPGRPGVSEQVWQSIMPTDLGEAIN